MLTLVAVTNTEFGLYAIYNPIAIFADIYSRSNTVLAVFTIFTINTDCFMFGFFAVYHPIAVVANRDSGSCAVNTILTIFAIKSVFAIFTVNTIFAVGSDSLIFSLYTVDDPVAIFTDFDCRSCAVFAVGTILTG